MKNQNKPTVLSWLASIIFTIAGIWLATYNGFLGVVYIIIAIALAPVKLPDNKNKKIPLAGKIIGGIVLLLMTAGALRGDKNIEEHVITTKAEVLTSDEPKAEQEIKPKVYIDEVYKFQQLTDQLINSLYQPPYLSFDHFARIKKNLEKNIKPTCDYFEELVETTGNYNSPYQNENVDCKNTVLSMMIVLFDLRDGDYNSIEDQRQKLIIINENLVNQLDEYTNTPEFKAKVNKYLVN